MICSSGIGFNPVIDGTRYTFDVAGLYNGLFVMADRQTGSVWTHFDGTVLNGPLANQNIRLEISLLAQTTWADWVESYPETLVLDWYPEFASRYRDDLVPGRGGLGPQFQQTLLNWDDRLPENELVLGVGIGEEFRAFVLADFDDGLTAVHDTLADTPIVIFIDKSSNYGLAFVPQLDGELIELTAVDGTINDNLGNEWDLNGTAVAGPNSGAQEQ